MSCGSTLPSEDDSGIAAHTLCGQFQSSWASTRYEGNPLGVFGGCSNPQTKSRRAIDSPGGRGAAMSSETTLAQRP